MSKFSLSRRPKLSAREKAAKEAVYNSDSILDEVDAFLHKYKLGTKKSLGQNFLVREDPLWTAVDSAEVDENDFVLEIGPGPGTLTRRLSTRAGAVAAVELDDKIFAALKKEFADSSNVVILHGNALHLDPQEIYKEYGRGLRFKVVANIPYYITSALLKHYLSGEFKPQVIVMLMQKEVALQAVSSKNRSLLSLSVQYYGEADITGLVQASSFMPSPKVDSAFLRIKVYDNPPIQVDEEKFFNLARHAFAQNRKTLLNSLSYSMEIDKEEMATVLQKAGEEFLTMRAGALSLQDWQKLYEVMIREYGSWK